MLIDNRYFVENELGEGGSGKVYRVLDKISGEIQALKLLNPDLISSDELVLFEREFLNLKKLSHPNIIRVYNFGYEKRHQPYFTMDFVEGPALLGLFSGSFDLSKFVLYSIEICLALDYLHNQAIIHRDLKPANILLKQGENEDFQALLTDFGMAENFQISQFDPRGGSHFYVSPEAIRGWKVDQRSDLYSLGVTLYEIATGTKPFSTENPVEVLKQHLHKTPENPTNIRKEIPLQLSEIILKLLKKNPSGRYSSALEVVQDLLELAPVTIPIPRLQASTQIWGGGFVGRKAELKLLRQTFEASRSQQNFHFVLINGEHGVGKTRLLQEFSTQIQLDGAKVFFLNSLDTKGIPYGLIAELIRQIGVSAPSGINLSEDEETIWRYILTHGKSRNIPEIFRDKAQIFDVFVRLLAKFSKAIQQNQGDEAALPLLAVLDDFQEVSESIRQFIRYLIFNGSSIEMFFVGLVSGDVLRLKDFYEKFQSEKTFHQINLKSFNHVDYQTFLEQKITKVKNFDQLFNDLYEQTSGNPLFSEHLLQYLIDKEILVREDGFWVWKGMEAGVGIPDAMSDLLNSRWEKLSLPAQSILQALALNKEAVPFGLIQSFFEKENESFWESVNSLLTTGIVVREVLNEKALFRLAQQSWIDFIEKITPPAQAKSIHERWISVIETQSDGMLNEWAVRLTHHALAGQNNEKAKQYLPVAAEYARSMFDIPQAIYFYSEYLKILSDNENEIRVDALEKLAALFELSGEFEKSLDIIQNLLKHADRFQVSKENLWDLKFRKVDILQKLGKINDVFQFLVDQQETWKSLPPELNGRGHYELGWIYRLKGEFEKAHQHYNFALNLFQMSNSVVNLGFTFNRIGVTYLIEDKLDQAEDAFLKGLEIFDRITHLRGLAHVHNNLGILFRRKGDIKLAKKHYQNCLKIRRTTKDISYLPQILNNLANVQYYEGNWKDAFDAYKEVLQISQGLGLEETTANVLDNIGMLSLYFGKIDDALSCEKKSIRSDSRLGNLKDVATTMHGVGDIYDAVENYNRSHAYYYRSLRLLEKQKLEPDTAEVLMKLGAHFIKVNQKEKALDYLIRAEDLSQIYHLDEERAQVAIYILQWAIKYHDYQRGEYYRNFLENNLSALSDPLPRGIAYRQLGDAWLKKEQLTKALENYQKSLEIFVRLGAVIEQARTHKAIALIYNMREDYEQAQVHLKKAVQLLEKIPARSERLRILNHLIEVQDHIIANLQQGMGSDNQITALQQTSLIVHSIFNLETMLHNIMNTVINLLKADRAAIIFLDRSGGGLEVKVSRGMEEATIEDAIRLSQSIIDRVEKTGSSVLSRNTMGDDRFKSSKSVRNFRIFSLMCVPLKLEDHLIGTVYVDSRNPDRIFSYRDLEFLENISDLAAVAISNSEYYEEIKRRKDSLEKDVENLREVVKHTFQFNDMIGNSKPMQEIFQVVSKILNKNVDILIRGESGTGKEKLAGVIHFNSNRKDKPFITVNCAAIPPTLLESELFGIEKRVATGVDKHLGKFEQANGGTIFLDEIGDMSMDTQAKILRVIQEREFQRIGGVNTIKVDVRIIAATNKNLEKAIQNNTFRQDLYYRLNVLPIVIPPLRERKEDIPLLIEHFVKKYGNSGDVEKITDAAMKALIDYNWPGNVRELENVIHRMMIFAENGKIAVSDLPIEIRTNNTIQEVVNSGKGKNAIKDYEKTLLLESLKQNKWNISKTAKTLGVHRNTLHRKLKVYKIEKPKL